MRYLGLLLYTLIYPLISGGQNLVPNGSFESFNICPNTFSLASLCNGWSAFHSGTSDYHNACNNSSSPAIVGVPANFIGYQAAAQGSAYMGIGDFNYNSMYYKELIKSEIPPLQIGGIYEVSISVSLANTSKFATNDLGVWFYKDYVAQLSSPNPVNPQVSYASYGNIRDTANWVRLTNTFTSDSAYDNIVIGGFTDYSSINMPLSLGYPLNGNDYAYYYIDSVVVKLLNSFNFIFTDPMLCRGDVINVPYTVFSPGTFQPGNTFTLQLSDASGSFASPRNIGSVASTTSGIINASIPDPITTSANYKLRIISSNPSLTALGPGTKIHIENNKPNPNATVVPGIICMADTMILQATNATPVQKYTWTGGGLTAPVAQQNVTIYNAGTNHNGDYILHAVNNGCEAYDTVSVYINPLPQGAAFSNSPLCEGDELKLTTNNTLAGQTYKWKGPNGFGSDSANTQIGNITVAEGGTYVLRLELNGCTTEKTVLVVVKDAPPIQNLSYNGPVCNGAPIQISTTGGNGVIYRWSGSNGFVSNEQNPAINPATMLASGIYTLIVSMANGCSDTATLDILVKEAPENLQASSNSPLCEGETLHLSASNTTAQVSYSWQGPGQFQASDSAASIEHAGHQNQNGIYTVTATKNGCTKSAQTEVNIVAPISPELGEPVLLCNKQELLLKPGIQGVSYLWQNGSTATEYNVTGQGKYWVTVTIPVCGAYSDTIVVDYEQCDCNPIVPTAFTPNNDGLNDKIGVVLDCNPQALQFMIFNRFGQAIFKTNDARQRWNGTFEGIPADLGTYYYLLKLTGPRGKSYMLKGDITLIR